MDHHPHAFLSAYNRLLMECHADTSMDRWSELIVRLDSVFEATHAEDPAALVLVTKFAGNMIHDDQPVSCSTFVTLRSPIVAVEHVVRFGENMRIKLTHERI